MCAFYYLEGDPNESFQNASTVGHKTGETCGSVFWVKLNQRYHNHFPADERYVAEIERTLLNVGIANQAPAVGAPLVKIQPGAVTGTVGMKPTYGGVSRYGAIALASSLDQVGPVTRTVLDAGLLHDVIGGHDPRDSTSIPDAWPSFADAARRPDLRPERG